MKKFILMFGIIFTFVFLMGFTTNASDSSTTENTETTEVGELPGAGIKPGSFLYRFDKFFENVSLRLTFREEKRVEKLSRFAEERLAELNELDPEAAEKYSDELFNEYGLNIEKANIYVQKLAAEGKISDSKIAKIEKRVEKAERKEEKVRLEARECISQEVKEQVQEAIHNSKMSIFNRFNNIEEIKILHDEGYGYGVLLKLQAIGELSSKSINELLQIENAVTTNENNEKEINFKAILEYTQITQEQLNDKLKEYRDNAKEDMNKKMNQASKDAKERLEQIRQNVKQKEQEKNNNK